ncbi:hypothetical protein NSTC731_00949 [Nostoc sp. DSM 114167]|jgi:hypothetical protein
MIFILNSYNVVDYLVEQGLCNQSKQLPIKIEPVAAKNFNLLITLPNERKLLVKQERHNQQEKRYDSGVLYFNKRNYEVVRQLLKIVYQKHQLHLKSEIPLFTKQLALGLGLAEEPDQKFAVQESFGMNRCQIVANGLLTAWYQEDNSIEGRMQAIREQFSSVGIELHRSYLNANSEDIY